MLRQSNPNTQASCLGLRIILLRVTSSSFPSFLDVSPLLSSQFPTTQHSSTPSYQYNSTYCSVSFTHSHHMDFPDKHVIPTSYLESSSIWIALIACLIASVVAYYIFHIGCIFSSRGRSRHHLAEIIPVGRTYTRHGHLWAESTPANPKSCHECNKLLLPGQDSGHPSFCHLTRRNLRMRLLWRFHSRAVHFSLKVPLQAVDIHKARDQAPMVVLDCHIHR